MTSPYVSMALWSEGPTDQRFLRPLLRRAVEELIRSRSHRKVLIAEDYVTLPSVAPKRNRAERIADAVKSMQGAVTLLFLHADGAATPSAALKERIQPAIDKIMHTVMPKPSMVAVVPVRETEAWALCDPDAICRAMGIKRLPANAAAMIDSTVDVEKIGDPKKYWNKLVSRLLEGRRHSPNIIGDVGTEVSLPALRRLSAYGTFEKGLEDALRELHCIV